MKSWAVGITFGLAGIAIPAEAQLGRLFGGDSSISLPKYSPSNPQKTQPVLVRISYPARIEAASREALAKAYKDHAVLQEKCADDCELFDGGIEQAIAKSNYFAWRLFQDISARLPPNMVLLQPVVISMKDGVVRYESDASVIPAVLNLDFFAFVQPRRAKDTGIPPASTFGPNLRPIVEIRTDSEAAPKVRGLLATTAEVGKVNPTGIGLDSPSVITGFLRSSGAPANFSNTRNARPANPESHFLFPFRDFEFSRQSWEKGQDLPGLQLIHAIVADLLNALDQEKATHGTRLRYQSLFDPRFGVPNAQIPNREIREKVLFEFEKLEVEFLHLAQAPLIELYRGEFGKKMREYVEVEWTHHDKIRSTSQARTMAIGGAILGALVGARAGVDLSQPIGNALASSLTSLDAERTGSAEALSKILEPGIEKQNQVLLEFGEKKEKLEASSIRELRAKLALKYRELFGD